jgi:hypothetical protein
MELHSVSLPVSIILPPSLDGRHGGPDGNGGEEKGKLTADI